MRRLARRSGMHRMHVGDPRGLPARADLLDEGRKPLFSKGFGVASASGFPRIFKEPPRRLRAKGHNLARFSAARSCTRPIVRGDRPGDPSER